MLQTLLLFIIISVFCIIWGLPFFLHWQSNGKLVLSKRDEIFYCFFIGLSILSVVCSWVSLISPVRLWSVASLTLLLFSMEVLWMTRAKIKVAKLLIKKSYSPIDFIFVFTVVLLFTFLAGGKPSMEDSDLYHVQTIKWINEYGTVPGLANLYLRYGFYTNWFHTISAFKLFPTNQNFLYLNYTFTVWLFLFLFHRYKTFSATRSAIFNHLKLYYFVLIGFMLVEWDLFRVSSSSTSYDFVITGVTIICIDLLIRMLVFKDISKELPYIVLLLLLTLPFFKLTGFLSFPFALIAFLYSKNKKSLFLFSLILMLFCLMPFMYKNYIQTGYVFFPYKVMNIFEPAWKVPEQMVYLFNRYIYLANHYINQQIPNFPRTDESLFSFYHDWFLHLVRADQALVVFSIVAFPISGYSLEKKYKSGFGRILLIYFLCIPSLAVWLVLSPDTRFAFAFLIFLAFFPLTALVSDISPDKTYAGVQLIIVVSTMWYLIEKNKKSFNLRNIIFTQTVDTPPCNEIIINNNSYFIPKIINNNWNSRCLDSPLPCIYQINPYLKRNGPTFQDGFKTEPTPDSSFILNYRY